MRQRWRKWPVAPIVAALLAFSGVALATPEDAEDTVLNFGYDSENHVFVWNASPTEGVLDCTLEGSFGAAYGITTEGLVMVEGLTHNVSGEPVTFPARDDAALDEDYAADGECGLGGGDVSGPNGQVNHGMFMKFFNSVYEGSGRGCLMRHIAQSDLGKGDQHIQVGEVDPAFDPVADGDTGILDLASVMAGCDHGRGGDAEAEVDSSPGRGRPDSPGKSGSAPGHNP